MISDRHLSGNCAVIRCHWNCLCHDAYEVMMTHQTPAPSQAGIAEGLGSFQGCLHADMAACIAAGRLPLSAAPRLYSYSDLRRCSAKALLSTCMEFLVTHSLTGLSLEVTERLEKAPENMQPTAVSLGCALADIAFCIAQGSLLCLLHQWRTSRLISASAPK